MPNYFADAAVQQTTGGRGKTTRRKSTKTVRGCDGAYCAMVKEEMAVRPAGWLVRYELTWEPRRWESGPQVTVCGGGWFPTEEAANAYAATLPVGPESRKAAPNVCSASTRTRVWVEKEVK
jgi:hypothetical protein